MGRFPLSLLVVLAGVSAPCLPVLVTEAAAQQTPAPTPLPAPPPRDCERKPPEIS